MTTCPECAGPRIEDHPAGLVFKHEQTCSILAAEDATQAADAERGYRHHFRPGVRRATDAERTLLAACGFELPADAKTYLDWLVEPAVRRRSWDGFEGPIDDEGTP